MQSEIPANIGVFSVHMPSAKSHLILVAYSPDSIRSRDILDVVTQNGLHAELVGL